MTRIDPRFLVENRRRSIPGPNCCSKRCLETPGGVGLLTGYPGLPVVGFFDSCHDIKELLKEHGVAARMANNEAISVAMVNGAQMVGVKAIAVFKSVGLHVASDALALGNLAGIPFETVGRLSSPGMTLGAIPRRFPQIPVFCTNICACPYWSRQIRKS